MTDTSVMAEPWLRWPFCDVRFRPKTQKAFEKIVNLPTSALEIVQRILWEQKITVLAPTPGYHGMILPAPKDGGIVIYLDERLEKKSQSYVDYVVAHELAHVVRGDSAFKESKDLIERERLADALVRSWGFKVPKRRAGAFSHYQELSAPEGFAPPVPGKE